MNELQEYVKKYFDQRPQFERPRETPLGMEIPVPWRYVMESMIVDMQTQSAEISSIRAVVDEQAKDEGLWFYAKYATEAYIQNALRRLHEVIEGKTGDEIAREIVSTQHKHPMTLRECMEAEESNEGLVASLARPHKDGD